MKTTSDHLDFRAALDHLGHNHYKVSRITRQQVFSPFFFYSGTLWILVAADWNLKQQTLISSERNGSYQWSLSYCWHFVYIYGSMVILSVSYFFKKYKIWVCSKNKCLLKICSLFEKKNKPKIIYGFYQCYFPIFKIMLLTKQKS